MTRNVSWLMLGNLGATGLLGLLVLVLPKLIDIELYGAWQLFLFYTTYMGYLSWGLSEGVILRYGGKTLDSFPCGVIKTHFFYLSLLLLPTFLGISLLAWVAYGFNLNFKIIAFASVSSIFYLLRMIIVYSYHAVNRMELFAKCLLLERLTVFILSLAVAFLGIDSLLPLAIIDLFAKILSLILALVTARRFFAEPILPPNKARPEVYASFKRGIFVSLSALATVLVPAISRWTTEASFGLIVFSQVALAFSLVNLFQTFVNSFSMAFLPALKRNIQDVEGNYRTSKMFAIPVASFSLLLYFPLSWIVQIWLPNFDDLPLYLAILFPMLIAEAKTRLIAAPFLQAIDRERQLSLVTISSLLIAVVLAFYSGFYLKSVVATVLSITIVVTLRALVLEFITDSHFGVYSFVGQTREVFAATCFILFVAFELHPLFGVVFLLLLLSYGKSIVSAISRIKT